MEGAEAVKKPNEAFFGKKKCGKASSLAEKDEREELDSRLVQTRENTSTSYFLLQPLSLCERAHVINNT